MPTASPAALHARWQDLPASAQRQGNSLHGGGKGFDKQVWQVVSVKSGPVASVVLSHVSPDGDAGYPGTVKATVTYSLDEAGNLTIAFEATTDKPTIINMTNHAIFNLAGEGAPQGAMDHVLTIPARPSPRSMPR
jgi:aldose 1-epimerase